jgi:transposase
VQDRDGAKLALKASRTSFPFVQTVFSVVKRPRALSGFEPLPRRWVIERSFAWLIKNRRLVRDFEQCPETSEALITIAAATTLIRRLR